MKSILHILIEAIIVGILLIFFLNFIKVFIPANSWIKNSIIPVFLAGALFHLACEYSGINVWYARDYCKRLSLNN